jgi:hypothetical protein
MPSRTFNGSGVVSLPTASMTASPGARRPLGIVLICLGMTEINEDPIAKILGD